MKTYIEITTPKDPEMVGRYVSGRLLCVYDKDVCIELIRKTANYVEKKSFGRSFDDISQEWNYKVVTKEDYELFKLECL